MTLTGFGTVNRDVVVTTGQNVNLTFSLKVGGPVEETVTVTAETPVVDTKRVGTSTTLTKEELSQIPQSRDPWAVLKTVPGVIVDRVNVAGNESGQQSGFVGKGAAAQRHHVEPRRRRHHRLSARSAPRPTYFDFDAFDEINVTTGGNDLQGGDRRPRHQLRDQARHQQPSTARVRGFLANHDLQSNNLPDELEATRGCTAATRPNHTDQITDYGADLGGPIVKDKLWFWGSYGKNDIRIVRLNQTQDKTLLKNYNAKLNWQASANDMVSFFCFNGAKEKFGPLAGRCATNEPDSLPLEPGQLLSRRGLPDPLRPPRPLQDRVEPHLQPELLREREVRVLRHGATASTARRPRQPAGVDSVQPDTAYGSSARTTVRSEALAHRATSTAATSRPAWAATTS